MPCRKTGNVSEPVCMIIGCTNAHPWQVVAPYMPYQQQSRCNLQPQDIEVPVTKLLLTTFMPDTITSSSHYFPVHYSGNTTQLQASHHFPPFVCTRPRPSYLLSDHFPSPTCTAGHVMPWSPITAQPVVPNPQKQYINIEANPTKMVGLALTYTGVCSTPAHKHARML